MLEQHQQQAAAAEQSHGAAAQRLAQLEAETQRLRYVCAGQQAAAGTPDCRLVSCKSDVRPMIHPAIQCVQSGSHPCTAAVATNEQS